MQPNPVIRNSAYCLAHVPGLVVHGSKPRREMEKDAEVVRAIRGALRTFDEAAAYPPNRTYLGGLTPDELAALPRPWHETGAAAGAAPGGAFGTMLAQDDFYARLAAADVQHPVLVELGPSDPQTDRELSEGTALPLWSGGERIGCFRRDNRAEGRGDPSLGPYYLLENLCAKASGAHALETLLAREGMDPAALDFIISCGEEACGDRYQRGGGGLAKAIGEQCGCVNASGMDVKNFCAAPASALVTAGALVRAGLYERVAVVGGGSLAKLGMKFASFVERGMPILDDCLASMAFLVTADDGRSPVLRLERGAVGLATIGASASTESVYRSFLKTPLDALGLRMTDIDRYAPELHNPEIMEQSGSGDVVRKNYRMIAALAVLTGEIGKADMNDFIARIGMPGFAPTQGHIPSGVPYIGHAAEAMRRGTVRRVMVLAKASLFLNRLTELFDGVSFVLEANPGNAP